MDIGIAFDLRSDFLAAAAGGPEDRLEEYDSDATVDAILEALRSGGHTARRLGGGRRFLETVLAAPPDLVFNLAEGFGTRSREAHVPSVCEMLRIPFTHSDPLTLAATLDKAVAKRLVAAAGIATPRFAVADDPRRPLPAHLGFPVIVKPLFEGSSMGVRKTSKVRAADELPARLSALRTAYAQPVLVEEFLPGAEFTVGVRGNGDHARVLGVMEIVPKRDRPEDFVYSLEVKRNYTEEVNYHVPPRRPDAVVAAIGDLALAAYRALECRDLARVDVRLDAEGRPHFLEVNPLPGINPVTGDIVIIATRSGVSYRDLILGVVDAARARHGL